MRFRTGRRSKSPVRQLTLAVVIPALILTALTKYVSILYAGGVSLTDWGAGVSPSFLGLANYVRIFTDPETRQAFLNTLVIAASFFIGANVLGLFFAVSLNGLLKTRNTLRTLLFLPVALSSIATAYVWRYIFDYKGLLNQILGLLGFESMQKAWLVEMPYALWTIAIAGIWQWAGLAMIMYLAGLQVIPKDLYEAAASDGVGQVAAFRYITFPLLAPAVTVTSTLMLIHGFRIFDMVLGLTGGGPANATQTLATELWQQSFVNGDYGFGSSIGVLLTVMIAALSIIQVGLLRTQENKI